ncbi:hypothetical protein BC828DRAFT_373828 [Blastocladiella britannica]|nr:hypothetical protein BC828DRAFT_373828 [Blastocladiella britannica]
MASDQPDACRERTEENRKRRRSTSSSPAPDQQQSGRATLRFSRANRATVANLCSRASNLIAALWGLHVAHYIMRVPAMIDAFGEPIAACTPGSCHSPPYSVGIAPQSLSAISEHLMGLVYSDLGLLAMDLMYGPRAQPRDQGIQICARDALNAVLSRPYHGDRVKASAMIEDLLLAAMAAGESNEPCQMCFRMTQAPILQYRFFLAKVGDSCAFHYSFILKAPPALTTKKVYQMAHPAVHEYMEIGKPWSPLLHAPALESHAATREYAQGRSAMISGIYAQLLPRSSEVGSSSSRYPSSLNDMWDDHVDSGDYQLALEPNASAFKYPNASPVNSVSSLVRLAVADPVTPMCTIGPTTAALDLESDPGSDSQSALPEFPPAKRRRVQSLLVDSDDMAAADDTSVPKLATKLIPCIAVPSRPIRKQSRRPTPGDSPQITQAPPPPPVPSNDPSQTDMGNASNLTLQTHLQQLPAHQVDTLTPPPSQPSTPPPPPPLLELLAEVPDPTTTKATTPSQAPDRVARAERRLALVDQISARVHAAAVPRSEIRQLVNRRVPDGMATESEMDDMVWALLPE